MKDRLFFFAAYEGQRKREDAQVTRVVPSAAFRTGSISYLSSGAVADIDSATDPGDGS